MEIFTTAIGLILSGDKDLMTIIALSLRVSLSATLIAALFAIPAGAALAILQFPGRRMLLVISSAFMALPPVVVGLAIYLLLSRSGPLGTLGLLFTPTAMIVAQTVLIFPIILSLTHQAVQPLNREYISLFNALDTPRFLRIRTIIWDARFAVSVAILAGFGRALAEVGAVIIVGGNINGLTRVMTTTIALETSKGNLQLALALGLVLLVIAFSVNLLTHTIARMGEKYQTVRA
ncbi:MAG: ABC transporter permease [Amylibacter sp.]|jgi:tungstate transport system permease protein|nr:ABC transporter permease [Amylibacter sp.]